jgi:hypothetical protein
VVHVGHAGPEPRWLGFPEEAAGGADSGAGARIVVAGWRWVWWRVEDAAQVRDRDTEGERSAGWVACGGRFGLGWTGAPGQPRDGCSTR